MPPVNAAPGHAPPACRPWGRRFAAFLLIALRHSSTWILRIVFSLLILLLVLFAYLHLVGLPAYLADVFLDRMAGRGYHLQIERLTLEIDRGLVASNVRMYATAQAAEPFMTAQALTVALNPVALLRERKATPVLSITDGMLRAQLGQGRFGAREGSRTIVAEKINLRFSATGREVRLREFEARFLGIQFRGRGAAYGSAESADADRGAAEANPLATALRAIEEAPDGVLRLVEHVNALTFGAPPLAEFTFALYLAHPEANTVSFRIESPAGGNIRNIEFDGFRLDMAWNHQRLDVPDLQLHKGKGTLGVSGWLDTSNQTVSLHLVNTLPLGDFLEVLPAELRTPISGAIEDPFFPLRVDLHVGPAPWASAAESLSGRLVASRLRAREVPIEHLDVTIARQGDVIRVDQAELQLDTGPLASRLTVRNGEFLLASRQFQGRVAGTINPHVIKPWLSPNFRTIVDWFGFHEPLAGDVMVGGTVGNPAIYCYGPVQATNFTIYGVAVQSMQGDLNITNEVMHLTGATLVRPEGVARGDVHMAFSNQTLRLDVDSLLDPRDHPAARTGRGRVHGAVPAQRTRPHPGRRPAGLLQFLPEPAPGPRGEAQRFGYDRWEADSAIFDLNVAGRRLYFTNATATAYGGTFAGHGTLYPVGNDANWRYEVDVQAAEVRLDDLLAASFEKPMDELRGTLDGAGKIGGYVGIGTGPSVTGSGPGHHPQRAAVPNQALQRLGDHPRQGLPRFQPLRPNRCQRHLCHPQQPSPLARHRIAGHPVQRQGFGALCVRRRPALPRRGPAAARRPRGRYRAAGHPPRHPPARIPPDRHLRRPPLAPRQPQPGRAVRVR
jgi:hypothetical protein